MTCLSTGPESETSPLSERRMKGVGEGIGRILFEKEGGGIDRGRGKGCDNPKLIIFTLLR